ncbi:MAG: tetratricopeptide repeat protein [Steroidobacteraceae bacterium]
MAASLRLQSLPPAVRDAACRIGASWRNGFAARALIASIIICTLFTAATAHSTSSDATEQTLAAARASDARHDYSAERKLLLPLAEQGVAVAQYNLGVIYAKGEDVPTDYAQAVRWFRKAAEQGLAPAQYAMGLAYAHGQGVPKDNAQAVHWLHLGAQQGNALAQAALKIMYAKGYGAEPSPAAVAGAKGPLARTTASTGFYVMMVGLIALFIGGAFVILAIPKMRAGSKHAPPHGVMPKSRSRKLLSRMNRL